jgi:hypothetical protein
MLKDILISYVTIIINVLFYSFVDRKIITHDEMMRYNQSYNDRSIFM